MDIHLISPPTMAKSTDFKVTCILHVVYANEASCQLVGHERSTYGSVTIRDPEFMRNREAFVGAMIQGAEELYGRLKAAGPDGDQDSDDAGSHSGEGSGNE